MESSFILAVHLNKDLLKKSLTISRRLLESCKSLVACPYLCDILYNRLLYANVMVSGLPNALLILVHCSQPIYMAAVLLGLS
ncbi:hypothetical protein AA0119_g11479 [Alternaria tenuissima]|uniref:Uncharacterized protein n=2 Tax=Alternaria alternata complex TaxID=187734 RepID=A0A4Q4N0S8_ALTAL|nr:hypothetical protein AA0117_g12360 [Alternaria alternata]RYN89285.1 hypothetical protein AA0119_g11479 [Alternaria tenuissima]